MVRKYTIWAFGLMVAMLPRIAAAAPFVYVANADSDNVTVIDAATNTVTATISVGNEPRNPAVSQDGTRVYVPNRFSNSVTVINGVSNTVVTTITGLPSEPYSAAVSPDATRVYVANKSASSLTVINATTNTVITTISDSCFSSPEWVTVNPAGTRAYVASKNGDRVCVVNTSTNTVLTSVTVGSEPRSAVVTCNGAFVYVANNSGSTDISKIRTSTNTVVASLNFSGGGSPRNISISPGGGKVYVGLQTGRVGVINTNTDATSTITMGSSTYGTAVLADGSHVYVTDESSNKVEVLKVSTGSVLTGAGFPISTGSTPRGIATSFACSSVRAPALSMRGLLTLSLILGLAGLWVVRRRATA